MGIRFTGRGLRSATLALVVLGTLAAAAPWGLLVAGDDCCSMPSCCGRDDAGCERSTTIDRVGCCGPAQPPAVQTSASDAPATRESDALPAAPLARVAGRTGPRLTVLLADRDVADGPPSPVPLFTVHSALLL